MANIKGIDVSTFQGKIDFTKVKKSDVKFVILRAGYGKLSSQADARFETNYKNAKECGLDVGAYWYSYAQSENEAKKEAEACIKVINGKKFEYPIFFDLEESNQLKRGKTFCSNLVKSFCFVLENAGYFAGLYISRSPLQTNIDLKTAQRYALWIAEYNSKCNYEGSYGMWQYSSEGKIDGISGDVDLDYSYVDYPSIIKNNKLNGY